MNKSELKRLKIDIYNLTVCIQELQAESKQAKETIIHSQDKVISKMIDRLEKELKIEV